MGHDRPVPRLAPRLYAHRGAAIELPENTLPSFARAIELGADAIETDAHLTRDGHIVLSHDPTGARMCGVPKPIAECSLEEVRRWDAGALFEDRAHERSHAGKGFTIPTLAEALRAFPSVAFNVDAKSRHPAMVSTLVDLVRAVDAEDRTLLASFSTRTLRAIRRYGYRGQTGLGQAEVVRLFALPTSMLARGPFKLKGAAAQIPYRIYGIDLGTKAMVEKCHALGLEAHYWTVNAAGLAKRLLANGADAIMTDDPGGVGPEIKGFRRSGNETSVVK
jgi:glycerophosphoryl diester phosphodiesterase